MEYRPIPGFEAYEIAATGVARRVGQSRALTACGRGKAYYSLKVDDRNVQKNIAKLTAAAWPDREIGARGDYRTITLREYWDMLRAQR